MSIRPKQNTTEMGISQKKLMQNSQHSQPFEEEFKFFMDSNVIHAALERNSSKTSNVFTGSVERELSWEERKVYERHCAYVKRRLWDFYEWKEVVWVFTDDWI